MTRQRRALLAVLEEAGRPLTRGEWFRLAREYWPRLGTATLNRAIRDLTAEGRLIGVDFPGQKIRYELPSPSDHPHFICRGCGKVFDWDRPTPEVAIDIPAGFDVSGHEVLFYGRCPQCGPAPARK